MSDDPKNTLEALRGYGSRSSLAGGHGRMETPETEPAVAAPAGWPRDGK